MATVIKYQVNKDIWYYSSIRGGRAKWAIDIEGAASLPSKVAAETVIRQIKSFHPELSPSNFTILESNIKKKPDPITAYERAMRGI